MIPLDLAKPGVKLALGLGGLLLVILLCLATAWGGYRHGHATAKAAGDKVLAELRQAEAEAWAESKAKALDRYVAATRQADQAAAEHLSARQRLAAARTLITKEIPHATAGLDACAFGPDFLRVYNQALGLGAGGMPAPAGSGQFAANAAAPAAADAGLRDNAPLNTPLAATASATDLLTHLRDVGEWCQATASQRDALLILLEAQ